jgi:hypothetical protein
MKKKHWKKLSAFIFIIIVAMLSRGIGWLDGNWYGTILAVITVAYIAAECFDNAQEIKITAGLGGVSFEKENKEVKGV